MLRSFIPWLVSLGSRVIDIRIVFQAQFVTGERFNEVLEAFFRVKMDCLKELSVL